MLIQTSSYPWMFFLLTSLRLQEAAAAALFTACKIEDTLKKSRDILCCSYNLKLPPTEQLSADDPVRTVCIRHSHFPRNVYCAVFLTIAFTDF